MISRRRFLQSAAALGGTALGVGFYTWQVEPHWLEIVERPLPIADLPVALEGARLAQLSDLHIGPKVDDDYLVSVFQRVRAAAPDIVVYTGDFTSYAPDVIEHSRRMFAELPLGRRATFGSLGNHDYGPSWGQADVADQLTELSASRCSATPWEWSLACR